mmetsp:Transcript_26171/g.30240  ORF Transcript_26171/g.30240 Transcript_26171/m.30240 type:complete len:97 (+) Transcript_26171:53-343(+)
MAHEPPFKAPSMPGLYKKVIRGKIPPIKSEYSYSEDLIDLVKLMLKVDIKYRPTAKQILEYPVVQEMEEVYMTGIESKGPIWINERAIEKPIYIPK